MSFKLLKVLSTDDRKFVVRGALAEWADNVRQDRVTKESGYLVKRRSVRRHGYHGYFKEVDRQLQMLDLDGVPLPGEMSVITDPMVCINWAVDHLLPPEFGQASFVYQLSASAGLTKRDNELNVHLWFFTNREYANENLRAWARWWNAKQQRKIIDPVLFSSVQPHYTNEPELLDGLIDPLAGRRLGLIYRRRRTVKLYMPTAQEVADELGSRHKRAAKQYTRARKTHATQASRNSQPEDDSELSPETETEIALEGDSDPFVGGPYFDAVKLGPGWRDI
jgi:hypothetical protein